MNSIDSLLQWLAAASLRASLLAASILVVQLLLRRWLPPRWRHALWLPMLLVLVLPVLPSIPSGTFAMGERMTKSLERMVPGPPAPIAAVPSAVPLSPPVVPTTTSENVSALSPVRIVLAIGWLAGCGGVLAVGLLGYRRSMRKIVQQEIGCDPQLEPMISRVAEQAGLKRVPRVIVSPAVESPAMAGGFRPVLLLPAGFPQGFTNSQARLVLLHEFMHVKRRDLPMNWLMFLLQALHWFNPLLWFAFARMRADREAACDAQVLSLDAEDHRSDYGHALLKMQGSRACFAGGLGFVGLFDGASDLKSRIRGISNHRRPHPAWRVACALLVALLTLVGATRAEVPAKPAVAAGEKSAKEVNFDTPGKAEVRRKLETILIPRADFDSTTLDEAVGFLRKRSVELDVSEPDAAKRGVNFMIRKKEGFTPQVIREMRVRNIPLGQLIGMLADQTGMKLKVDDHAVMLLPREPGDPTFAEQQEKLAAEREPGLQAAIDKKLRTIVIPVVDVENTSLEEIVDFLRARSVELDQDPDKAKRGVNFVVRKTRDPLPRKIERLKLTEVTLQKAIEEVAKASGMKVGVDPYSVTFYADEPAE